MSYVVINAVKVPDERRDAFEERFAKRAGHVQNADGFEAFELLRPLGDDRYLVYTRWASKEQFEAWVQSPDFAAGHQQHEQQGPVSAHSEMWSFEVLEHLDASN